MKLGRQIASGWELDHRPQVVGENLQDLRNASLGFLGAVGRSWPRSSNILLLSAALMGIQRCIRPNLLHPEDFHSILRGDGSSTP